MSLILAAIAAILAAVASRLAYRNWLEGRERHRRIFYDDRPIDQMCGGMEDEFRRMESRVMQRECEHPEWIEITQLDDDRRKFLCRDCGTVASSTHPTVAHPPQHRL